MRTFNSGSNEPSEAQMGAYGDLFQQQEKPGKTLADYFLIFRERKWWGLGVFATVLAGGAFYTWLQTPLYKSQSIVQILKVAPAPLGASPNIEESALNGAEDFNTELIVLQSSQVIDAVANRLKGDELARFLAPYSKKNAEAPLPQDILASNRGFEPIKQSLIVAISYSHPDKDMAARVANLFAEEAIKSDIRDRIENSMKAVDALRDRVKQQQAKVESLGFQLTDFREKNKSFSLDAQADIDKEQLMSINSLLNQSTQALDAAKINWAIVQQYEKEGKPLWDIPFVESAPQVAALRDKLTSQAITLASVSSRYRDKHPSYIEAKTNYDATASALNAAVQSAKQSIYNTYFLAQETYDNASKRLTEKKEAMLKLSRQAVEYDSIVRELNVNQDLYHSMLTAMDTYMAQVNLKNANLRIVQDAAPSSKYDSPKIWINLSVSATGGVVLAIATMLALGVMDRRVKTLFDIETDLGLPLIGALPLVGRLSPRERAQVVALDSDKRLKETFQSIYSSLKVNGQARSSKVILIASTNPNEGKSFVTTNLAITYAQQGERVLVIDCDLRRAKIAWSLALKKDIGLLHYLEGKESLTSCISANVYPNLDVLPAEERLQNAAPVLNNYAFKEMLEQLRGMYDRIFIDTSPMAAVSDAVALLPNVDAVLYVIKYSAVSKDVLKAQIKRILESETPILGVILNQAKVDFSAYYRNFAYSKDYDIYYGAEEAHQGAGELTDTKRS